MENKDQAAFPDPMRAASQSQHNQNPDREPTGMSKRELMSSQILAGYLASMNPGSITKPMAEGFATDALMLTDALLTALEQTKTTE